MQEYYAFIEDDSGAGGRKLGFFAWLYCCLAVVETAVVIKFGRGMFPKPWPTHVLWFWGMVGTVFALVMGLWVLRIRTAEQRRVRAAKQV